MNDKLNYVNLKGRLNVTGGEVGVNIGSDDFDPKYAEIEIVWRSTGDRKKSAVCVKLEKHELRAIADEANRIANAWDKADAEAGVAA